MSYFHQRSIFWFRQDLRLEDNHGLIKAIEESESILPIFIFDTDILSWGPSQDQRLLFLSDTVRHLKSQLQKAGSDLLIFKGKPTELIPELIQQYDIQAIYANKSYGYGSKTRDIKILQYCNKVGVQFTLSKDFLLVDPEEIPSRKVFTPYSKWRYQYLDNHPIMIHKAPNKISTVIHKESSLDWDTNSPRHPHRSVADISPLLSGLNLVQYNELRNMPGIDGTSKLSPYIRFGLISIRKLYLWAKPQSITYTNELARRDFRQHIAYYFPETRGLEFQEKRRQIQRSQDQNLFEKRCKGETGYPIVDAGMKQLQQENWMHGRVRMVVASFLTKDLMIDRRLGEQWFAKYLLDYDTNVNIGNRQWSASVGADPKPLRIFNPILQSQRFDPQAQYILKYIPELVGQPLEAIHDPLKYSLAYHKPIVDHYVNSKLAKQMYYKPL